MIFSNPNAMSALSPEQRAFLIEHELMHARFLLMKASDRSKKLWNVVKAKTKP